MSWPVPARRPGALVAPTPARGGRGGAIPRRARQPVRFSRIGPLSAAFLETSPLRSYKTTNAVRLDESLSGSVLPTVQSGASRASLPTVHEANLLSFLLAFSIACNAALWMVGCWLSEIFTPLSALARSGKRAEQLRLFICLTRASALPRGPHRPHMRGFGP